MEIPKGTLEPTESHPAAYSALEYLQSVPYTDLCIWQESFSSNAIEGNRLGEICSETLYRLMHGKTVSDRYLLGLAWVIRNGREKDKERDKNENTL